MPNVALDYDTAESTAAPFMVFLLPGSQDLADATAAVTFTVNPNGTITFPPGE
jgi:hypothetical protein